MTEFCNVCNNLFYIKEQDNKLMDYCKVCGNIKESDKYIIIATASGEDQSGG